MGWGNCQPLTGTRLVLVVAVLLPGEPLETADTTSISESIFWIYFLEKPRIFLNVSLVVQRDER